ncbi:uncharacterized protein LOC117101201 [Anneissia japonica]|uniref:uncharacterized protein LOC117101201 n=1 Tax=Anneissia japonica TaxID=1529436 RepID=UPI0014257F45|nr:uncharacterized protein LOC117101201 [Anneissia japonica]
MMFLGKALSWLFVSCVIFTSSKAFQNDSQEIVVSFEDSCANRCSATRLSLLDCACDEDCLFFGDCSKDYLYYCSDDSETSNKNLAASIIHQRHRSLSGTTKPRWSCIANPDSAEPSSEGILAVASCPPSWSSDDIRRKCEVPGAVRKLVGDDTGYVYASRFCGICNMDVTDSENNTTESNSTFSLCASSSESTTNCSLEFLVEEVSEISVELRPCSLRLLDTCPHDKPEKLVLGCSAFIDVIIYGAHMYKNNMCLNCYWPCYNCNTVLPVYGIVFGVRPVPNGHFLDEPRYILDEPRYILDEPRYILDEPRYIPAKVLNLEIHPKLCIENEYYDEVTTKCQRCNNGMIVSVSVYISILNTGKNIGLFDLELLGDFGLKSSDKLGPIEGNGSGNYQYEEINEEDNRGLVDEERNVCITCRPKIFGSDTPVDDGYSDEGWVTLTINNSKLSCRVLRNYLVNVTKEHRALLFYNRTLTIVNVTVCIISLVALLISILTLCCFPSLLNLPGICRLCLMLSLFLAQFIMLTIAYVTKPEIVCIVTAAIMHFFWLAMFMWTNVIAFDLARVFGTQSPRSSTSNKRLLVGLYMLYGWGIPAVVIALCLTLHFSGKFDFRYGGEILCWFSNHRSVLYAFGIPVAICIVFNFVMYIVTVIGIWKVRRISEIAVKENERGKERMDELKIYIKLSILMGLTWSLVFITVYSSEIIIWYIFIILNGLQGFFIFIAFTCKRETLTKWKGAYATCFEAHPRSRPKVVGSGQANNSPINIV